jgi:type IV pilus assembly protein PilB
MWEALMAERRKLGELLVMGGAINQSQLATALSNQRQFGQPLGKTLVRMGFLDEETMVRTLARQLKLPVAWLDGKWVDAEIVQLVPAELALKHCCLPLAITEDAGLKVLHLAMQDPGNLDVLDLVGFQVGFRVSPVLAAPTELEEAVQRHYGASAGGGSAARSRPEVQEVPELLMFELKATTPTADLDFSFGPTSGDPALVSAQAALRALTQLLSALMGQGIISREEVAAAIRKLLNSGDDEILLLEDESL